MIRIETRIHVAPISAQTRRAGVRVLGEGTPRRDEKTIGAMYGYLIFLVAAGLAVWGLVELVFWAGAL